MAYTCEDSGSLMAIAQQLIQQKQQQRQQQSFSAVDAEAVNPFSTTSLPWIADGGRQMSSFGDQLPFVLPESFFPNPCSDDTDFHLSDFCKEPAFDSDEWMESLIVEFPSSELDFVVFPKSLTTTPPTVLESSTDSASTPPLLKSLLYCSRIIDTEPDLAAKIIVQVRDVASDSGDLTERVAFYFAEALSRTLSAGGKAHRADPSPEEITLCYKALNDVCPYYKFAQLTANQAILEATESADRIHIVDFGIEQGIQWAALLQALATRPAGKPCRIRISGIPAASSSASLSATGKRLIDFARQLDLNFEFEQIVDPADELTASSFGIEPGESVAVNFMLQLHTLLCDRDDDAAKRALRLAKSLRPSVVTVGEKEIRLNRVEFPERFGNAMGYYSAVFESLEAVVGLGLEDRARIERVLLGPRILRAVAPEDGRLKSERMETKEEWRAVMEGCGLEVVPVSHYAVSQAKLILWNYGYSHKYTLLDSTTGFLTLGWADQPLLTVSTWR